MGCAALELLHLHAELSPCTSIAPTHTSGPDPALAAFTQRGAMQEPFWVGFTSFQASCSS